MAKAEADRIAKEIEDRQKVEKEDASKKQQIIGFGLIGLAAVLALG